MSDGAAARGETHGSGGRLGARGGNGGGGARRVAASLGAHEPAPGSEGGRETPSARRCRHPGGGVAELGGPGGRRRVGGSDQSTALPARCEDRPYRSGNGSGGREHPARVVPRF